MSNDVSAPRSTGEGRRLGLSRSFGVGCFHFGLDDAPEEDVLKPQDYVAKVRSHLSRYPNVEEVSIEPYRYSAGLEFVAEADSDGDIAHGLGVRPCPADWSYNFRLNLPLRLQRELLGDERSLEAEQIVVTLRYAGEMPVAIVEGHEAYFASPSTAVVLVRRYLEQYSPTDTGVSFRYLGPSPFHADFFVKPGSSDGSFEVAITEQPGYDDVEFSFGGNLKHSDLVGFAHHIAATELGVYYWAIQNRNRLTRDWSDISEEINRLVERAQKPRAWFRFKYGRTWRANIDNASLDLAGFKLRADEVVTSTTETLDRLSRREKLDHLRKYADAELAGLRQFAIQDFSQILSLLERRSRAQAANVTAMVAAVLGAIAGAGLTMLFGALPK